MPSSALAGLLADYTRSATEVAALAPVYPTSDVAYLPVQLLKASAVSLGVYDALGRCVATPLATQTHPAGTFTVTIPTATLAPGLYTLRLVIDGSVLTRQLSIQRKNARALHNNLSRRFLSIATRKEEYRLQPFKLLA